MVLAASGALRSSPTDAVEAHLNVLPVELLVKKITHHAALRLMMLPPSHPLAKFAKHCSNRSVKHHKTPLHTLSTIFNLKSTQIKKIKPVMTPPWMDISIKTLVLSRDQAIVYHKNCEADFRIFTDGSGYKNGIGAAVVMYRRNNPPKSLTFHLGSSKEHMVQEGETVSLTLGGQLLESAKKLRGLLKIVFVVDNTATKAGTTSRCVKAAQEQMLYFRKQVE